MAEWYISNSPIILMCIKNSHSCATNCYNYSNIIINNGQQCYTKQLDYGEDYLKWIGIFVDGVYYGAHRADNFVNLIEWRNMRIEQILS